MNFDEFTGTIQHRLQLPDTGKTVRAIRATLTTLGTRLPAGNAADLAASMPMEIGWYLTGGPAEHGERFGWSEFVERVSEVERVDRADAAFHSQVVIDLVGECVPESDFEQLRDQLPHDADGQNWRKRFGVVDSGGWNEAMEPQVTGVGLTSPVAAKLERRRIRRQTPEPAPSIEYINLPSFETSDKHVLGRS